MSDRIVCKPTPWFLLRAAAMILMFGIFAVLFYKDGKWGYKEQNYSYYLWKATEGAAAQFAQVKDKMSPEEWSAYAAEQTIDFSKVEEPLPEDTPGSMKWPDLLRDYAVMEEGLGNPKTLLFDRYRDEAGIAKSAPDKPFTQKKISEQWVVFWICITLCVGALFILIRTLMRRIILDGSTFQPAGGKAVQVSDLIRMDLRKWKGKGLAFVWAKSPEGSERKIRIDGLTYGGFRQEEGQPAEKLMESLRSKFSGELIEYEQEDESKEDSSAETTR